MVKAVPKGEHRIMPKNLALPEKPFFRGNRLEVRLSGKTASQRWRHEQSRRPKQKFFQLVAKTILIINYVAEKFISNENRIHQSSDYLGHPRIIDLQNDSNILGAEDQGPAKKWIALIRKTLNNVPGTAGSSACHTPSPAPKPIIEVNAGRVGLKQLLCFLAVHFRQQGAAKWTVNIQFLSPALTGATVSVTELLITGVTEYFRPSDYRASDARPSDYWASDYRASDFLRCSDDDISQEDSPSTVLFSPMSCGGFLILMMCINIHSNQGTA
ncbi:hypothetical protein V2J09_006076 [Rumex salicifolius]